MLTAGNVGRVRRQTADLMLLVTVCLWALNFSASKFVLSHGISPLAYSTPRYLIAAAIFLVVTLALERSLRVSRGDLVLLGCGSLILFVNQVAFTYALHFSTATTVALVFGTFPIFAGLFAMLAGLERLTRGFVLMALVSFAGVALIAAGSGSALSASLKGDALALLGAATWAGYSVLVAPLMTRNSPFKISLYVLSGAALLLAIAGERQVAHEHYPGSWRVWATFAFAVLGPLVITNVLWFTAIDRVGPGRAALFYNLQFVLAALFGVLLLSESITGVQLVGGAAIAAAILLSRVQRITPQPVE
jgi:drug/metabolite transporter (DMT)-like permease